jgi:6-phosphogluconate dehydrogenase
MKETRETAETVLAGGASEAIVPDETELAEAFEAARILAHAQGFSVMQAASEQFGWGLDLARIAEIWREGCIIRSALLDDLAEALRGSLPHGALVLAPDMASRLGRTVPALRRVVGAAVAAGLPVPAMSASLAWYDSLRQARGTANLIQGQRDFFGMHGFARIGEEGKHHGPWWD